MSGIKNNLLKNSIIKLLVICLIALGTLSFGAVANAQEIEISKVIEFDGELISSDNMLVIEGTQTPEEEAIVDEWLNNSEIEYLIVLDPDLLEESFDLLEDPLLPQTRIVMPPIPRKHRVNNVKSLTNVNGSVFASTSGSPGMTLSLSVSESVSRSVTAKFGASNKMIETAVGFSVTGKVTVTNSTSMKVPTNHNNRNVKRMTLSARPIMQRKSFRVQSAPSAGSTWRTEGTGTASRPIGVAYTKSYTYK